MKKPLHRWPSVRRPAVPLPFQGRLYSRPAGAAGSPDRGCEAEARQRMGCRRHSADVGPALGRLCCPSQGRARTLVRAAQPPLKGEGDRAAVERSLHEMTGVRVLRQFRFPGFRLARAAERILIRQVLYTTRKKNGLHSPQETAIMRVIGGSVSLRKNGKHCIINHVMRK